MTSPLAQHYPSFVRARFKTMPTRLLSLLHAAIGIAGEALEAANAVTREHGIEELGDIEFYLEAGYHLVLPSDLRPNRQASGHTRFQTLENAGIPLDIVKKAWVYNRPFNDTHFLQSLNVVANDLEELYHLAGFTQALVLSVNMEKLARRYPVGYTDEAAQARADKQGEVK